MIETPDYELYSDSPRLILGFHGCDESVAKTLLLTNNPSFKQSENDYDWLGDGMYFWENDPERAYEYVHEAQKRDPSKYPNPTVIGAVLDLGHCLNLTEDRYKTLLKDAYERFKDFSDAVGVEMPKNENISENDHDRLFRKLDKAVITFLHVINSKNQDFDSVRAMFIEGKKIYPNAGFNEKTHVQIAIRNPNMVKGYFRPIIGKLS